MIKINTYFLQPLSSQAMFAELPHPCHTTLKLFKKIKNSVRSLAPCCCNPRAWYCLGNEAGTPAGPAYESQLDYESQLNYESQLVQAYSLDLVEGVGLKPLMALIGPLGVGIIDEIIRRRVGVVGTHVCAHALVRGLGG